MNLQILWFCVVAFFWSGYFVLEGFDFGVGMLLPFLPHGEEERSEMFRSIGPVWDGNEVWLVVAGAATFAAFPSWYGTMFSGFYLALLLVLVLLILRVVSFEWRDKGDNARWRRVWMWANAVGSAGIPLVWGVALADLIYGLPIDSGGDYTGNFWDLFSAYSVLAGVAFVLLFAFHGAGYLAVRTSGDLYERARRAARALAVPAIAVGAAFMIWTVVVAVDQNLKDAFPPVLPAVIAIVALLLAGYLAYRGRNGLGFAMTAIATLAAVATLFTGLYPRVMVSSTSFSNSLTVSGTASVHYTLAVMSVVALVLVPVILLYQSWNYYVFRARITGSKLSAPVPAQSATGPGPG
jgi:cytochrome bd ubiquinol oxidase subunit II